MRISFRITAILCMKITFRTTFYCTTTSGSKNRPGSHHLGYIRNQEVRARTITLAWILIFFFFWFFFCLSDIENYVKILGQLCISCYISIVFWRINSKHHTTLLHHLCMLQLNKHNSHGLCLILAKIGLKKSTDFRLISNSWACCLADSSCMIYLFCYWAWRRCMLIFTLIFLDSQKSNTWSFKLISYTYITTARIIFRVYY